MNPYQIPGYWRWPKFKYSVAQHLRGQSWIARRFKDPAVHEGMLLDKARCDAYAAAIARVVRPGDVVVDLGAGTAFLSLLALKAGARHVYAIEMSGIADVAAQVIAANNAGDRITLVRKKSTAVALPERADVLVSETFSIMGFDTEHMIAFLADARTRLLKPDARMIPLASDTCVMPIQTDAFGVGALPKALHGLDFTPLRSACYTPRSIRVEASGRPFVALADPVRRWHLEFAADPVTPRAEKFEFRILRDGRLDGFLGWFEGLLAPGVTLSNSPFEPPTSWSQIYFPLIDQPVVRAGDVLSVELDPGLAAGWPKWTYRWQVRSVAA
jgi:hypothetical protein